MRTFRTIKNKFPAVWMATSGVTSMIAVASVLAVVLVLFLRLTKNTFSHFGGTMLALIVTQLLCILPVAFAFMYFTNCDIRATVRLKKGIDALQILLLACVGFGAIFFANGINSLFLSFVESLGYTQIDFPVPTPTNLAQMTASVAVIAVLPAFCEEFMFRGLVMRAFERYSPVAAALMSALLFSIMHGTWEQVVFAFILGLVLSYVVLLADSLWASIVIHFVNNAFSVVYSYGISKFFPDIFNEAKNTSPSMATALIPIVIGLIGLGIFLTLYTLYTRYRNTQKYGHPLPVELVQKPLVKPMKRKFLQYAPLILFFTLQLGQMTILWLFPQLITGK